MHPIAFQLGSWPVHWYGVMVATGFLAGLWTASRRSLRDNIPGETILDLGPWLILGAIIGARFLYVVSYWREGFADKPWTEIFMIQHGGLVFYGGLIGSSLACIGFALWRRVALWPLSDVLAPSIALGYAFGRVGCLLNGCCYGRACSLPWAIQYPPGHETYPTPVHPAPVYDAVLSLALYFALAGLYRRKRFHGQVFALYLIAYALVRSFVEYFRGDYPAWQHFLGGWATPAQVVSIFILAGGLLLYRVLPRTPAPTPPAKPA